MQAQAVSTGEPRRFQQIQVQGLAPGLQQLPLCLAIVLFLFSLIV